MRPDDRANWRNLCARESRRSTLACYQVIAKCIVQAAVVGFALRGAADREGKLHCHDDI